ncbi:Myopalladin, partial [Apaloderma vittatum]
RWYCEGKELENSPDIQIIQTGDQHSLVIVEAFEEDTGRYSCFASNIYGTDSTSAEIYIEGVSSSDSEGEIKDEMDQATFIHCIKYFALGFPHQNLFCVIPKVCFSCIWKNNLCTPKCYHGMFCNLQAQSPTNYLQGLDGRPIIAAPVFTKMLQDISASEGQLVVFECRVKGAPSPKVEWYREGTLIEDSPDFRILQKIIVLLRCFAEEICTLVIAEVFSEDSGSFTCTASNKYGTVSSIARLTVKASEDSSNTATLHTTSSINLIAAEHQPSPSTPSHQGVHQAPKPKLEGVLVNHNEPRSSSKIGLRVHFKLPEDDKGSESSSEDGPGSTNQVRPNHFQERINGQPMKIPEPTSPSKEPPPVLAKPKLDQTQLKQLHNQVLLEQQQVHQAAMRELSFSSALLNSATSLHQQSTSTTYKQSKASASQTFGYTRPKQFLPPQTTLPATSSPGSPVTTLSNIPQGTQRANNKENFTGNPPPAQARSAGGFPSKSEQSLLSPKESTVPPLTLPTSNAKQFQPQSVTPAPVSPTGRIQNPVAFLSAVLPSFPTAPSTNAMGLPRSTPATPAQGLTKKNLKPLPLVTDDSIRENKAALVKDLERKLHFREDVNQQSSQQEYRISSFEQRLMNEIEFRLERTPVDESDDEIQHEEIPTGKYIAPIFDKRLKHFRVMEGSPITFTCKIVGIPVPKVYWFKDGKQISKKNTHFKMNREEDGTCSLHIEASANDDDGNYTIMAANPQGRISCSGHLMVQSIPVRGRISTVQPHRARPRVPEGDKEAVQERFFRPYFLQAPGDMVAHEGRLCRLDCKVSGLPTPDLTWLLNGKPVLPDGTHKMLVRETGVHSLLIDPLSQNDAGTYTCLATNKTGQNSFSLELTVVAKEVKKAPMFLEKLQNCGVPEGYPVRLECRVVGMPPPIFYWKKDNETIPSNRERMSMHQDTTGYVCLLIQPAKKADAGWYTLSAKNEAGIVSCTARLDIYAQWHRQIPQPIKLRPGGSWYANLTGQGLDIFSAFPTTESPVMFASATQKVVESEEL